MDDESTTTSAAEEASEAPVTEAAPAEQSGAPATTPEGFIEQERYENLRKEFNQRNALWDRARQGDLEAMRELDLPLDFGDDTDQEDEEEQEPLTALEQRQAAMEQWAQQREAQEGMNRFNADLDTLLAEKSITLSPRERLAVFTETVQKGDSPDALKSVVEDLAAERVAYDKAVIDRYVKSKRAPHVSKVGTGATETPYRDDMSLREMTQAAQEQARLLASQE